MTYNPFGGGFNSSYLGMATDLGDPRRQEKLPGGYATQGQAVSAPYAEANMAAAEKTNPMNAESQMPGKEKSFLDDYIGGLAGKALGIGADDMIGGLAGKLMGREQAEKNAMFGYLGGPLAQGNPFGLVGGLFR
tara:strand:- start:11 stop:412 length:402 start_codon:yes stop_codon:yes gene_type:complete